MVDTKRNWAVSVICFTCLGICSQQKILPWRKALRQITALLWHKQLLAECEFQRNITKSSAGSGVGEGFHFNLGLSVFFQSTHFVLSQSCCCFSLVTRCLEDDNVHMQNTAGRNGSWPSQRSSVGSMHHRPTHLV